MSQVSVVIITKDEQANIGPCLESARWADEIIVVDSHSADDTAKIAEKYGAKVLLRRFTNFADQKNFAIAQATKPWIFSLDADERISEDLKSEIRECIAKQDALDGYYVFRNNYVFGRCLRHGGQGRDKQMRLFRAGKARFRNVVHEEVDIEGSMEILKQRLDHYSYVTLNDYLDKFTQYTDLEVVRMREKGVRFSWMRLFLVPEVRFIHTYVLKGGFLDGYEGYLFHLLSAVYAFVKYAKLREADKRAG